MTACEKTPAWSPVTSDRRRCMQRSTAGGPLQPSHIYRRVLLEGWMEMEIRAPSPKKRAQVFLGKQVFSLITKTSASLCGTLIVLRANRATFLGHNSAVRKGRGCFSARSYLSPRRSASAPPLQRRDVVSFNSPTVFLVFLVYSPL